MIRFILTLAVCLSTTSTLCAQGLHFAQKEIKMGILSEDDAPRAFDFHYKNKTSHPILIKKVETTCGCAQPHYKKGVISPNEEGIVSVTFYPMGRAGNVRKSIFVNTDTLNSTQPTQLILSGTVTASTDPYINYPYAIGPLRLMQATVHFHKVKTGQRQLISIEAVNSGEMPLSLTTSGLPHYISFIPETIAPKEKGDLKFIIHPEKLKDKGEFKSDFLLEGVGNVSKLQRTMTVEGILE